MGLSRRKRIGVLQGGDSTDREISLRAGAAVAGALDERGYIAVPIHVDRDVDLALRQERIDVAFLALRGRGADGPVQGLLEMLGVPYTGSSFATSSLTADKLKAKELLRLHNLPTPAYYRHARDVGGAVEQHHGFGYPCVVKPRSGRSGIGVALVRDDAELERAVEAALALDDDVLVERYVAGCEVQVVLLEGRVLGLAEVVARGGILDYSTRMTPGSTDVFVPPRLGAERLRGVVTHAVRAHHLFGCSGLVRVDLVVSERENECILEVDCQPDLSPGSLVLKLAHAGRLEFADLVERIIVGARLHASRRAQEPIGAQPWSPRDQRAGDGLEPN